MAFFLGLIIFAFALTSVVIIPFIDLLYKLHFTYHPLSPKLPSLSKLGTPIGGGVIVVALVTLFFWAIFPLVSRLGLPINSPFPLRDHLNIIFFTFISFASIGLYDDIIKTFHLPYKYRHKTALQVLLSLIVGLLLHFNLELNFIHFPFLGTLNLGLAFIPLAAGIIFLFTRGVDISDGLDGLSSGLLLICLLAFWAVSVTTADSITSTFIALWIGSLLALLYFNVYPARIWLGDSGSLAFGATLAVIGITLGKTAPLMIIGAVFVGTAVIQVVQRLLFKRTQTLHQKLVSLGWPEPKVVMRLWLLGGMCAILGLWLASG